MKLLKAILMLVVIGGAQAHADGFYSGNGLYNECVGNSEQQSVCLAYVAGAVDMMLSLQEFTPNKLICNMDKAVDNRQVSDIVRNYAIAHPERRHYTAASLVVIAINAAFPCPPEAKQQ
jgi:Ssp1 endopeptidase immunity protein Rap1a